MTGSNYERKLANILDEHGYHVIRAPSSGSATTRSLPDIAYSKPTEETVCVELKTTGKDIAYFSKDEVEDLQEFAVAFHGVARLCARFKQDTTYYLCRVSDARENAKSYAVSKDIATDTIVP